MRDKCRTAKEKADMTELNALVTYSAGHRKQACRGCEIDGVHVECSRTSTREMLLQLDECTKAHNHGIESDESDWKWNLARSLRPYEGREVGSKSLQRKADAGIDMLNPIFAHH